MNQFFTFLLLVGCCFSSVQAQVLSKRILIANGGQFNNPAEPTNLQIYNPQDGSYTTLDTIRQNAVQRVLVDGTYAYVAASDSIVCYDVVRQERVAAQAFGGVSTVSMALSEEYVLVGNFFLPFGGPDPYPNNLRVFERETLAFVDSIPALSQPVKGIVVQGDRAYVNQNMNTSNFQDTSGYMVVIDLNTLEVIDTVEVNQQGEDLGLLVLQDSVVYGLNGVSNTLSHFDTRNGSSGTVPLAVDLQTGTYGSRFTLDEAGRLFAMYDGGVGILDLATATAGPTIFDTVITAVTLDTVEERFYVTQTDFFSYTGGIIYDEQGQRIDTLLTGFAPEAIEVVYNSLPVAQNDSGLLDVTASAELMLDILGNDQDADAREPLAIELLSTGTIGTASLEGDSLRYVPNAGQRGLDSLQYVISDEWGDRDTASIYIQVEPILSIPTVRGDFVRILHSASSDYLTLVFVGAWAGSVDLIDVSGRVVDQKHMTPGFHMNWRTEQLPAGVYMLRGHHPEQPWHIRWMKR